MSGITAVFVGALALGMAGLAGWLAIAMHGFGIAAFIALIAAFMWALVVYVWRDRRGKLGGRIAISDAGIDLALPANRSLVYRPPACTGHFAWLDVSGMTTRVEVYGAQGMAMEQRPYWLNLHDGRQILLFEERALETRLADQSKAAMVNEIATRGGLALTELPMAQGKGGIFGAWFVKPPPMDAFPLDDRSRRRLLWRVALTGVIAGAAVLVVALGIRFG